MKAFLLVVALAGHGWAATSSTATNDTAAPFAVVELFTSEGCSSCPPADKLLAEIAEEAKQNGKRIYPLSFHVDYWNKLGWIDPFSSPDFTKRQQTYARVLGTEPYTPQMIVNGIGQFVGSDRARARKAIEAALRHSAQVRIALRVVQVSKTWAVNYEVVDVPRDAWLHVAFVESGLMSEVRRGENAGRRLSHSNVVREFHSLPLNESTEGTITLNIKPLGNPTNHKVIALVQNRRTLAILGAAGGRPNPLEPKPAS